MWISTFGGSTAIQWITVWTVKLTLEAWLSVKGVFSNFFPHYFWTKLLSLRSVKLVNITERAEQKKWINVAVWEVWEVLIDACSISNWSFLAVKTGSMLEFQPEPRWIPADGRCCHLQERENSDGRLSSWQEGERPTLDFKVVNKPNRTKTNKPQLTFTLFTRLLSLVAQKKDVGFHHSHWMLISSEH